MKQDTTRQIYSFRLIIQLLFTTLGLMGLTGCQEKNLDPGPSPDTPAWRRITSVNSSLPDQQVNALAIGRDDVVWIGTANGLARLTGSQWTIFTKANANLPSDFIQTLALQPDGTVWVGTNQGLAKYDGTQWVVYTEKNSILRDKAIMSLTHDPINKVTWVGTARGVVSINADQKWTLFDELDGELIFSLTTDQAGALWLGTHEPTSFRGRIRRFYKGQWKTYQLDQMGFESAFPYAIGVDSRNAVIAVLAGTATSTALKFEGNGWTELAKPAGTYGLRALALRGDAVWVGGTALLRFGAPGTSLKIPGDDHGILSMATDSGGDLWIGTAGGGLSVYHP